MSEFSTVAFIDGLRPECIPYWEGKPGELRAGLLPKTLGCDALNWQGREHWPPKVYDAFIVLYFPRGTRVLEYLRTHYPQALIIPWIDPGMDVLFNPSSWTADTSLMLTQIRDYADAIGTWDPVFSHGRFLKQVVDKPVMYIPLPLVPHPGIDDLRHLPKMDMIVGAVHGQEPRQPAPTLACLVELQRHTGYEVVMMDAYPDIRWMSVEMGLKATFLPEQIEFNHRLEMLARAKLFVDLYTVHHYGRLCTHAAHVGTVSVSSPHTADVGHIQVQEWSDDGAQLGIDILNNPQKYAIYRQRGIEILDFRHDPIRVRETVSNVLTRLRS